MIPPSSLPPSPDPAYQQHVPNLDGGDGHSEHIIFGTNVNLTEGEGEGGGEGTQEATSSTAEDTGTDNKF